MFVDFKLNSPRIFERRELLRIPAHFCACFSPTENENYIINCTLNR